MKPNMANWSEKSRRYTSVKLLNECFDIRALLMEWRGACIVPMRKEKGGKYGCSNSRGISLFSVVGKQCCRVLIKRVRVETVVQ